MSALKILITSGGGLLGQYLNIELSERYNILSFYHNNAGNAVDYPSVKIDITDFAETEKIVREYKPDVIIHNAAVSTAECADTLPRKYVYDVNVNASAFFARIAEELNSIIIYTSTDLVYAGYRGSELKENAKLLPVSFYAETKLMGEMKIKNNTDNYLILRTALMYGIGLNHSRNHFMSVLKNLKLGKSTKLFVDQFRSPMELSNAAKMIGDLVVSGISGETVNFGGPARLSRYYLAIASCKALELNPELIIPVKMDEFDIKYKVEDVSMDIGKLLSFGVTPINIERGMENVRIMMKKFE